MSKQNRTNLTTTKTSVVSEPVDILRQALVDADPETMDANQTIVAWSVLDMFLDAIEERKELFRQRLLKTCEQDGVPTDKGGQRLWVEDSEVIREKRQNHLPEEADLKILLATKGIPLDQAFTEVKKFQMDASKLDFLQSTGKLTEEEVKERCKVAWALKVKHSDKLARALEDCRKSMLPSASGEQPKLKKGR